MHGHTRTHTHTRTHKHINTHTHTYTHTHVHRETESEIETERGREGEREGRRERGGEREGGREKERERERLTDAFAGIIALESLLTDTRVTTRCVLTLFVPISAHVISQGTFINICNQTNEQTYRLAHCNKHVTRHDSLSKPILQGTVKGGKRSRRQSKCWMDNVRVGHPCPCQNCSLWPSAEKTGREYLLNRPSCPPPFPDDPIGQEVELDWTSKVS